MTTLACQALLFDMDGVLLSSTAAVERVWRKWAMEHALDPDYVAGISHGRRSIATIRELLPQLDAISQEAENLEVERREMEDREGVEAIPGAGELLASLSPERWAIVTSATRPLAQVRLRTAGLPLPINLITAEMVERGKPHPEPYLRGAALLRYAPQDCVVLEDALAGISAAKAAAMRVIALTTTVSASQLAQADYIVKDCANVTAQLQTNGLIVRIDNL